MLKASAHSDCIAPVIDDTSCIMPLVIKRSSLKLVEEQILKGKLKLGKFLNQINCSYIPWKEAEINPLVSMNSNNPGECQNLTS